MQSIHFLSTTTFNSYSFFRIEITVNVNHSVDADINEAEINPKADNVPAPEMKSKPHFEVKLIKGSVTTRFACSFVVDGAEADEEAPSKLLKYYYCNLHRELILIF